MKEHPDIVKKLVALDIDYCKLRNKKDFKSKTPIMYDERGLFKDLFDTIWDAAKSGNCERLKQLVEGNTKVDVNA